MLRVEANKFGNVLVVSLQGRVVRGETESLRRAVLGRTDVSMVMLDLARVSTIDAGGLGVMLELREHTQRQGIELRLKNVTKLVRQVMEITRLDSVFRMPKATELAVAALPKPRPMFAVIQGCC